MYYVALFMFICGSARLLSIYRNWGRAGSVFICQMPDFRPDYPACLAGYPTFLAGYCRINPAHDPNKFIIGCIVFESYI